MAALTPAVPITAPRLVAFVENPAAGASDFAFIIETLWALFILCGVGQITLNAQTAQVGVKLFGLQLFGAGFFVPMNYPPLLWPLSRPKT